ncbi:MAG: ATP-binding protein [Gammaproteobacteria bacterium]|nr:ATP-binding protein [Gammaproteobacteria bacterium]
MVDYPILPRAATGLLKNALNAFPVVVLMGARQTGKSTLAQSEPFSRQRLYLTLDDLGTHERARIAPEDFLRGAERLTIDEVQREPQLLRSIKRVIDESRPRQAGRHLLTGSANLLLMQRVSESLAGRAAYVNLWPMTRRERMGLGTTGIWSDFFTASPPDWPDLIESGDTTPVNWRQEVLRSGYPTPALELRDDSSRSLWFDGYVRTYLERDLQSLAVIDNLIDFRRLMRAACRRLGGLANQSEISRDTMIPRTTVNRYLDLLETSFQLVRLPAFAVNRTKRLIKAPKLYWSDPGLAFWLSAENTPKGAHLENMVLLDLLAWKDTLSPAPEVFYWRTASGQEVDFVAEQKDRLLAIEVKATASPRHKDGGGLRLFREEHEGACVGGLLLHGGSDTFWMSEGILCAPWWKII